MKPGEMISEVREAVEGGASSSAKLMPHIPHCPAQRCRTPGNTVRQHKSDWLYSRNDIDLLNF